MGCWNGTCMISHLPIMAGEPIKLVLLQGSYNDTLNSSGYVYSGGLMSPAFLPISGTYNDYGMIEDIQEDWNTEIILKNLKKRFGSKIKVDRGKVIEDWTLEDLLRGIERGDPYFWGQIQDDEQRTFIHNIFDSLPEKFLKDLELQEIVTQELNERKSKEGWQLLNLSFVMIRQDVWDNCVKLYGPGVHYWNDEKKMDSPKSVPYYISGDVYTNRRFQKMITSIQNLNSLRKEDDLDLYFDTLFSMRDSNIFQTIGETRNLMGSNDYYEYCQKLIVEANEPIDNIYKQWSEYTLVRGLVETLRIGWMIQPGAGSQTSEWKQHAAFNRMVAKIASAKNKEED